MKYKTNKGILTIELLIAFAILLLSTTGIVLLTTSEQVLTVDAKTTTDALALAQQKIEDAKASAKEDFDALETATTETIGGLYSIDLEVLPVSECVKQITSRVIWNNFTRARDVELNTRVTDANPSLIAALGGECDLGPNDDWDNPGSLTSQPLGGQGATAIEVLDEYVYLTSNPSPVGADDFYIYKFNPNPPIIDPLADDPDPAELLPQSSMNLGVGINNLEVVKINSEIYAFLMNDNNTNVALPDEDPAFEQLIIVKVTNPQIPEEVVRVSLPGVDSSYPQGRVVHYYDQKLYIGISETAGPEFHILDATNPENPVFDGSLELNHNVADIIVRDDFAYLASTDNNHELMVINVSDPDSLEHPDDTGFGYNAPGNFDGSTVYVLGEKVYLGKKQNSHNPATDDFFVLDMVDVTDGDSITDGELGKRDITTQNNSFATGIIVRGQIAFISLDGSTEGLSVINLNTMEPVSACTDYNFPENNTSMDMDGDFVFLSNRSNDEIRVVYDQSDICE